mmetsp:Transcript_146323/g.469414  ORF Transcript_146323/g.469414 Transcript_146323/m.469414 type:complete len:86 (-) Transcript_146323:101-358(-)
MRTSPTTATLQASHVDILIMPAAEVKLWTVATTDVNGMGKVYVMKSTQGLLERHVEKITNICLWSKEDLVCRPQHDNPKGPKPKH